MTADAADFRLLMLGAMYENGGNETHYLNEDSFFVPPDFGKDPQTDWPLSDRGGYAEGCCSEAGYLHIPEPGGDICYNNELVGRHRLDLVVRDSLIVELKAVEELTKAHYSQLRSYLKAAGLKTGLLVNFSKDKADYRRVEADTR